MSKDENLEKTKKYKQIQLQIANAKYTAENCVNSRQTRFDVIKVAAKGELKPAF